MYRFRSIDSLLGRQELEKQQIYFASLEQLNDPLEGTRHYFWQGDLIIWKNYLKHFLLCLENVVLQCKLLPDSQTFSKKDIPIYISESSLPTQLYREHIQKINEKFFSNTFIQSYLQYLSNNSRRIYKDEMFVHLKFILQTALAVIFEQNVENGITPASSTINIQFENEKYNLPEILESLHKNTDSSVDYHQIMEFTHSIMKSLDVQLLLTFKESPKMKSIFVDFPQMYLDSVVNLTYPLAYVACFMDNCSNSSVWGTYGDNHTGVCLKFKAQLDSNPKISLKGPVSYGSNGFSYDFREHLFQQMIYSSEFDELDFFRNIGRLPMEQLQNQWYTDENGKLSICGEGLFSNEEEWRQSYWSRFHQAFLLKLPDWAHEKEYRIIISSSLGTYDEPQNRLMEYKFDDLEAIIFGMRTPDDKKSEIIEIIRRKCKDFNRSQFDFFEMAYSTTRNEFYQRKINMI